METQLRMDLLVRGARGVRLSEAGRRAQPHLQEMANRLRLLGGTSAPQHPEVTLGAPSYFNFYFLPLLVERLPNVRLRALDLPPLLLSAYAAEGTFDLLISEGSTKLPASWTSIYVGRSRRALFANPRLAARLGPVPVKPARVAEEAFIQPLYFSNGQLLSLDDGCPLSQAERRPGHAVSTIALGLELSRKTDQLVFGPTLMAQGSLERGEVVEIDVEGWRCEEPVYVAANVDRVQARVLRQVAATLKAGLART
jgi:DNA-binding transcriptional LysR family regulator